MAHFVSTIWSGAAHNAPINGVSSHTLIIQNIPTHSFTRAISKNNPDKLSLEGWYGCFNNVISSSQNTETRVTECDACNFCSITKDTHVTNDDTSIWI